MVKSAEADSQVQTPDILSPEWNDYVVSLLSNDEKVVDEQNNIYPNVAGLRRIAEVLLGEIYSSKVVTLQTGKDEDGMRATVVYEIQIVKGDNKIAHVYSDVADCWSGNCDAPFSNYAAAIAATRAEARALRKALKLRNASAEEMQGAKKLSKPTDSPKSDVLLITGNQLSFINDKCRETNINVVAFLIDSIDIVQESEITKVTRENASKLIQKLTKYINGEIVPARLVGYKSDWRS